MAKAWRIGIFFFFFPMLHFKGSNIWNYVFIVSFLNGFLFVVIGTAFALNMLFNVPIWCGVLLTGLSTLVLLALQQYGVPWYISCNLETLHFVSGYIMAKIEAKSLTLYTGQETWILDCISCTHNCCMLLCGASLRKPWSERSSERTFCSPTERKWCHWSCNFTSWCHGYAVRFECFCSNCMC